MGSTDHGSAIPLRNYGDTWKSGNPGTRDTQFPGIPGGVKPLCISTVYLYGVSLRCISTVYLHRVDTEVFHLRPTPHIRGRSDLDRVPHRGGVGPGVVLKRITNRADGPHPATVTGHHRSGRRLPGTG